jgi:hypothetical protein
MTASITSLTVPDLTRNCWATTRTATRRAVTALRSTERCLVFAVQGSGSGAWDLRRDLPVVRAQLDPEHRGDLIAALTPRRDLLILILTSATGSGSVPAIVRGIRVAGADPVLAVAPAKATGEDAVIAAAEEAHQVVHLACALGWPGGVYRLEDVLIEAALLRSPDLAARLADTLEPLEDNAAPLLETLQSFLESSQDRKATAARLHIHPNTLLYRLQRIRELTGLSPTAAKDVRTLWAAVAAWRLTRSALRCH